MFCVDCPAEKQFHFWGWELRQKKGGDALRIVDSFKSLLLWNVVLCYLLACVPNISYSHPPRPPTLYPRLIPVTSLLLSLRPEVPTPNQRATAIERIERIEFGTVTWTVDSYILIRQRLDE